MPSVVEQMRVTPKPMDLATWWSHQDKRSMTGPLDDEEQAYLEVFTSTQVDQVLRIGLGIATPGNLTAEQREKAKSLFGDVAGAPLMFVNYENRRRIVAHYATTHPATIRYEMGLYRLTRDSIPPVFLAERIYELFTGKEAFTGADVSRLQAGAEILVALVATAVLSKARSMAIAPAPTLARPLTDPIYDMPQGGGGMKINGRYYTEHALERMAPDTPQVRAEIRTRAMERLRKLGITENSPAWDACLKRALQKIDPRGVPPSVVEAEISAPGSTSVRVITAQRGQVVITVMPK
jgi:hypothetical protein